MLNINNPEADRLARTSANQLGKTIAEFVIEALRILGYDPQGLPR